MRGPEQAPELFEKTQFGDMFRHPAYGTVSVSRLTGTANLFGSQVSHSGYVRLTISTAEMCKDAYTEKVYGHRSPVTVIDLTEAQWAALVSSMGGREVPCTLAILSLGDGELHHVPSLPAPMTAEERLGEQVKQTMKEADERAAAAVADVLALVEGRLPKSVLGELTKALETLKGVNKNSREFHHEWLRETKETMVHEAKVEIEAMAQALVESLGLKGAQQLGVALAAPGAPRLGGPGGEDAHA
jgi:hypothetical protein